MQELRKSNSFYERCLKIATEINSRYNIALSFHNLGSNYQEMEEHTLAKHYFESALNIYETIFQSHHGHILKVQRGLRMVDASMNREAITDTDTIN